MKLLKEVSLYPGLIIHARTNGFWGFLIRMAVRSWGNHDGIVIRRRDQSLGIGDAEPPAANVKTIAQYNEKILAGKYEVKVFRPVEVTTIGMELAANWWMDYVRNSGYDYSAFFRLLLKAIFGDWWQKAAGKEWDNWCTEGCHRSYMLGAKVDVWKKNNPTPRTTEKRVDDTLEDVTDLHMTGG